MERLRVWTALRFILVILTTVLVAGPTSPRSAVTASAAAVPERVSVVTITGTQSNGRSGHPSVSADARFVAFESQASNLVANDTNKKQDVFVHDRATGETIRVSVASDGSEANADSGAPAISADGRFVVFESKATNLVPGGTNKKPQVYRRDLLRHETALVSVSLTGTSGDGESGAPAISADGRFVTFESKAANLVVGDSSHRQDVFLRDMDTLQTIRVSVGADGAEADGESGRPSISADGQLVAFESKATNLVAGDTNKKQDVFVRILGASPRTIRVSVASDGGEADGHSGAPAISADGRFVAFESKATNLIAGDTNKKQDIFVHELATGQTTRVSVSSLGVETDKDSAAPSISGDGRFVVFQSKATNPVLDDANKKQDVFLHDRDLAITTRVSDPDGTAEEDKDSEQPAISGDGNVIAFASLATNLVPGDTNKKEDVFIVVRNRSPGAVDDSAITSQNTAVQIEVLGNDSDPDGDPLTVSSFTQPGHGTVTFSLGVATYTPTTGFGGSDSFTYTITDGAGGFATATVTIRVNQPPTVSAGAVATTITLPDSASLTGSASDDGLPDPPGAVTTTWSKVSGPGTVTFGDIHALDTSASFSTDGTYVLQLSGFDGSLTSTGDVTITVNPAGGGGGSGDLPPDPSTVAPALDLTVASPTARSSEFLYTGPNPIQTGVAPGTIDLRRAAVVRGRVLDVNGAALPGVTISILNHPEFGQTRSRADGMFDMAVNGGGVLTVRYEKTGLLPAQRQVTVPWQDFVTVRDVVLIVLDPQVTTIDLNAGTTQVARGSAMTDSDGTRTATLLFPAGTSASMAMLDGSTQPLTTLNVRATEYTVGPNGPSAMPGELPPTSGYTYAVELSADEAIAAGAKSVTFNQPVINYVENFLAFPVGMIVPTGFYDRPRAAWVPSDNGRVIKITGVSGGAAVVDTVGTGSQTALILSTAERQQLAALYPVGQELWRVPISHFTPWDCNWPYGPPPDAQPPNLPDKPKRDPDDDCDEEGSIVQCLSQSLADQVRVTGTPFHLRYDSNRAAVRQRTLDIPLSEAQVPASLRRIELEITIAGRRFVQTFAPSPNLRHTFTWDGKDAYGRSVPGGALATVRVGYVYAAVYQTPAQLAQSFAALSGVPLSRNSGRQEVTISQEFRRFLGVLAPTVGGWSLSRHHAYDPGAQVLYLGDGTRRPAQAIGAVITTAAGTGVDGFSGDGGPATQAQIGQPLAVATAPDGSVYFGDTTHHVRRIGPDGVITTVAGNGSLDFSGDGGPATQAGMFDPFVAVAPDGSLYISDFNDRVRRVGPDGIITTVAGNGTRGFSGDGGPATQAMLNVPFGVAVAPDGSFYIVDKDNFRIRRVGPDGIITTVAGNGSCCFSGDGGPATQASLGFPFGVAVAPDGSILIADPINSRVRRVGTDGIITTFAGTGVRAGDIHGDGGPATAANLFQPIGVAVAADGSVYISEALFVRRVGPDGIITTVAGTFTQGFSGDGGPATQAKLSFAQGVAVAPDGSFYIGDSGNNNRIRRVSSAMPGFATGDLAVPSADGNEIYQFNGSGRHLRTLNSLTGGVRYEFGYDSAGHLIRVTDGDGNITTIERDTNGNPTAVVAPGAQRTTLALDANGYLARITNPASEAVQFSYSADGLMATKTDARSNVHRFFYDDIGRLIGDEDPAGGVKTLTRVETANGHEVTLATGLGRTSTYTVEKLSTGEVRRVNSDRFGARTTVVTAPNGTVTITAPDGTRTTIQRGPDPRFGMQVPVPTIITHATPGGRTLTQTTQPSASLNDPNDPLSFSVLRETVRVNDGRAFRSIYDKDARTMTTISREGREHVAVLDAQGRVASKQLAPELEPITVSRDAQGRITQIAQGEQTLTYTYDALNRMASRTDAAGHRTRYAYDAADRLTQVILPSGRTFGLTYDANGNRTQVVMPDGAAHTFSYTPIDREASYTPPGSASYLRSYNVDRALKRSTLPGTRILDVSYDSAGRDIGVSYPEAAIVFDYAAGDATRRLGRMTRTPVAAGTAQELAFTYDGPQVTGATWTGAAEGQFSYTYDDNFFLSAMQLVSDADTVQTSFVRDEDRRITEYGPFTFTRAGPAGAVSEIGDGNLVATFTYDALGRLIDRGQTVGSQQKYRAQLTYDSVGRIVRKVETVGGTARTYDYTYDDDGQLMQVSRDSVVIERYTYDAHGNRSSRQLGANPAEVATHDTQDRLTQHGAVTYQFDADGFLAQRGSDTFVYSARGELLSATAGGQTVEYSYDGIGRRVGRTTAAGDTQYFYGDPTNAFLLTAVRDPAGVLTTLFYDDAGLLFALERGSSPFFVATDQVGTPRLVTDSTGQAVKTLEFDAFGKPVSDSNASFDLPIGFAGGLADTATGLVRFGLRDYDPQAGRWTARDPIRFAGGQGNLFAYVRNNPINLRDPLGLFCVGVSGYLGIGGGAEVCYDDGDFSVCGEIGFGVGLDVKAQLNSGGVADTDESIVAEAKAKCGPFGVKAGGELDSSGCLHAGITGELGIGDVTLSENKVSASAKLDKASASPGCGIQAKLAAKICGGSK